MTIKKSLAFPPFPMFSRKPSFEVHSSSRLLSIWTSLTSYYIITKRQIYCPVQTESILDSENNMTQIFGYVFEGKK